MAIATLKPTIIRRPFPGWHLAAPAADLHGGVGLLGRQVSRRRGGGSRGRARRLGTDSWRRVLAQLLDAVRKPALLAVPERSIGGSCPSDGAYEQEWLSRKRLQRAVL